MVLSGSISSESKPLHPTKASPKLKEKSSTASVSTLNSPEARKAFRSSHGYG